jgi:hypothetical protein
MANVEVIDEGKKERQRSPNYPAVGLREAVERVRKLIQIDGKAGAPPEIAAKHIGYSSAHGQAMSVVAALKKFGLVFDSGGRLVPTQAALEIVNLPANDARRVKAIREAALNPSLYLELVNDHSERGLPAADVLEAELTTYKGFNPKAVGGFVKDFLDTLDFAGIAVGARVESHENDSGGGKDGMLDIGEEEVRTNFAPSDFLASFTGKPITRRYPFDISIPRSLKAELSISGEFRKEDLERLRSQVGRLIDNLVEAFSD